MLGFKIRFLFNSTWLTIIIQTYIGRVIALCFENNDWWKNVIVHELKNEWTQFTISYSSKKIQNQFLVLWLWDLMNFFFHSQKQNIWNDLYSTYFLWQIFSELKKVLHIPSNSQKISSIPFVGESTEGSHLYMFSGKDGKDFSIN